MANKLYFFRTKAGLTQTELAKETGIPQDQLSRAEKDVVDFPGRRWVAIAKALNCSVEDILD